MLSTIIVQATQQKNCLWPRSSVYLQFSFCSWFPNISWVDIWMMPLWHHWAIWNMGALKWTHGIIMGSKYQSVQISPSSISNHLSCLQDSKSVFLFSMRPMVLELWSFKGQRYILDLYSGEKIKLSRFSLTRCQIVRL